MKISDILHFSPNVKFKEIDIENKEFIIFAFKDRVNGFYLDPADELNNGKKAFAAGVLCVTAIDFLAKYIIGPLGSRKRFITWLSDIINLRKENSKSINENLSQKVYEDFRCGLIHEGRIKNAGQFSYDLRDQIIYNDGQALIINPNLFLKAIRNSFNRYIEEIQKQNKAFQRFKKYFIEDFRIEFELTGR